MSGGVGGMSVVGLLLGTGPVVQAVIVILIAFSVGSWGIIIYKLVQTTRARRESDRFTTIFWESKNLAAINTSSVGLIYSPVAKVFRAGYQELLQLNRAKRQVVGGEDRMGAEFGGIENVTRSMKRQQNVEMTKLEYGLTFLATTGSTSPFVGLFGTVWGIMTAFLGIVRRAFVEHPGGRPRHRRGADHDRDRTRGRHSGTGLLQLPDRTRAGVGHRYGKLHQRVPQHRGTAFLFVNADGFRSRTTRQAGLANQRHAAGRRDAGAADHLHGHRANHPAGRRGFDSQGQSGGAQERRAGIRRIDHTRRRYLPQ